ncbi:MAG: DMT family transporter [Alphaproteobacteria bacterium]|nr:DMT family transporter [Alphaproteobacteria bacterium]
MPAGLGYLYGILAALIWGGQLAMSRAGVTVGLDGFDVAAIRCAGAGIAMLPWFLARRPFGSGVGRTPWPHAIGLALAAGPLFILASMAGFRLAPLPHGAVLQPAAMVLGAMLLSAVMVGERLRPARLAGAAVIVVGLGLISGPSLLQGDRLTPLGDLLFVTAGLLFAIYSVLQKHWAVGPMPAAGAVAIIASVIYVPPYLVLCGIGHLVAVGWPMLVAQIVVQGLLTGFISLVVFGRAIQILGVGRAALFPALVPGAAIIIGIPLVGEWPTVMQAAGLVVVTVGLLVALSAGSRPG